VVENIKFQEICTKNFQELKHRSLESTITYYNEVIQDLVRLIRNDLSILNRQLICYLFVINGHFLRSIQSLNQNRINQLHHFDFQKLLRYYVIP
jgi:hypothetical protein